MTKYSRSQWDQITKRVKLASYSFDAKWKCLICGKKFNHRDCDHTVVENQVAVEKVRADTIRGD